MFIQTETTPNPLTLKFIPERVVLKKGTLEFKNKDEAKSSPLALSLFDNDMVRNVFLGKDFITVTKSEKSSWESLKPDLLSRIMDFYSHSTDVVNEDVLEQNNNVEENFDVKDLDIVNQIKTLLEEKIKPAVAQDGGDIRFNGFDAGIVYLELRGACAGCPSSTLTLKSGIENMLKYYIPEIKSVEAIN
ncbi:MAG: NifU family protein [Rickettsiales bacterium]|nr:NifU family protein [Rickettsiales bacterium]OUV54018.1 MAG: NifU family protein [Rickettsiales bacterium TMED127]|tara:strand:- start:63325 stop:63891 length:567 start_codon:yes stop_codon:yes gene_type:complete